MMPPARWKEVEELYHVVAGRAPAERVRLLENVDAELRREVESLLDQPSGSGALDHPAWDGAGGTLSIGSMLGPYRIEAEIGAGGMGRVYKARDTRVGRYVAIKQSNEKFTSRFQREANAIAALNHPNICTLYDVGPDYLVMEYIEGESPKGPLPLDRALAIAGQIAAALDAAHEKGIVHRDLKPANIKVRPDGSVKVLDFGLAKTGGESQVTADSPTVLSASGMILGTAGYMAPEQARGEKVDKRADVWAFGVVLYEMLTGSRLFEGATVSDCIADVLRKEPDLTRVPARVRRLLGLCLEKDQQRRLRSLGDWQHLIDNDDIPTHPAPRSLRRFVWFAIPAILLAAAAAFWSRISPPAHAVRFEIPLPDNVQFDEFLSLSPDGRKLVFNATGGQTGLWLRDLDKLEWRRLPGTEGGRSPFWSPDSRFVGFALGNELRKINVAGGFPQTIAAIETPAGLGSWNKDGVIVFGGRAEGGLHRVADTGGPVTDLTRAEGIERFDAFPSFLPDQKHFLYLAAGDRDHEGVYIGSIDAQPASQPRERLLANAFSAGFVDGNILFVRNGALMMQRFDGGRLAVLGDPVSIAEHVATVRRYSVFSAIPGALAYRTGASSASDQINWYDREGKIIGTVPPPNFNPRLSRDGARAIVSDSERNVGGDYWILNFATGASTRLTFQPFTGLTHKTSLSGALCSGCPGLWSPDGASVFFPAGKDQDAIYEKAADGSGAEREWLTEPGATHGVDDVSPDGHFLVYLVRRKGEKSGLWALKLDASRRRTRLLDIPYATFHGRFSPDGRWFTYATNESGRPELYVQPFIGSGPNAPSLGPGRWQITRDGISGAARWRANGRELYYLDANDVVQAVEVDGRGPAFQVGASRPLLTAPCSCGFDVTPDGERFLLRSSPGAGGKTPITVVLNWQSELNAK